MVKRIIFIFVAIELMVGCADIGKAPVSHDSAFEGSAEESIASEVPSLMNTELLYVLLVSEIAGQRGRFDVALKGYLKAAQWSKNAQIAERATRIALFLKNSDDALKAVSLWVELDPENASAQNAAALGYLLKGDQEKATRHIDRWLALSDGYFDRSMIEVVRMLDKDSASPLEIMQELSDNYGERPAFLLGYSLLALSRNRTEQALERVDAALSIKPGWDKAQLLKARIVSKGEDGDVANKALAELVADNPEDPELRFIFSQFLIRIGDYERARSELERVVGLDPKKYDAQFSLAGLTLKLNDEAAARKLFLELTNVPKWRDQAYFFLGRLEADSGQSEAAVAWFDRVPPGVLKIDAELGAVVQLAKLDRNTEANDRLNQLRAQFPDKAVRFYLIEAEILTNKKDYKGAFAVLGEALKLNSERAELLYSRALVAERMGRLDILEQDLKTVLSKNPDDVNALNALGYTLVDRTSRYEEAQGYLQRAIKLRPNDPVIIDSFGWLQFRLRNYDQALRYLRRAFAGDPDPEIAAHLGEVLWMSGRQIEAKDVWQKALQDEPTSEYLEKIQRRFPKAFKD